MFGPESDDVTGEWRRLRNEVLNDLYSSPNIIQVFKSRRMKWGHLARIGERRGVCKVLVGNLKEPDHLDGPGADGRIILRWIFRKRFEGHGLD